MDKINVIKEIIVSAFVFVVMYFIFILVFNYYINIGFYLVIFLVQNITRYLINSKKH